MDTGSSGIPFLDELRRRWQEAALSGGDALNQLTLWEDDAGNRTEQELDAAWALRGEIESDASATQLIPTIRAEATPPAAATPTPPPSSPTQASTQNGDEQLYNLIPRLRDLTAQATAARSRRDWGQIATLRAEADSLIEQHDSNGAATSISMPDGLAAIFAGATEAQEAERLVGEAHASRRKGDFSEAAYRLAEAARLDPRYTPLSAAQQLVSDLQRAMRDLRDNSLNSPEELAEGRKLARRLAEGDAAPESEYVTKKLADIEAEITRRVDASKQYVDADLATVEEPGSLDDRLQAASRLGTELGKVETLRPDAPYLPEIRSRYIGARRQIERLKLERDTLLPEIANLDPQKGFDTARLGSVVQRLEGLAAAPFAKGDSSIDTAAQNLAHRLNAYLSSRLPTEQTNAAALQEYEQVLALSQRGPHPLSAQQVSTYNAAIQKARGGGRANVAPHIASPGSTPPGSNPRPGSQAPGGVPLAPRGTMPVSGGSTYPPPQQPAQGSQYGARPGSNPPGYGYGPPPGQGAAMPPQQQPHYAPQPSYIAPAAHVTPQAKPEVKKGAPVWAWLLPLLIVLGVGGYFGWNAYQTGENQKKLQAQAAATAQAAGTATANARETAAAVSIANANATATAEAEGAANAQATETAAASAAETETATVPNGGVAVARIERVTVDYDVMQDRLKGMLIHVNFTTDNLKDVSCGVAAYFYESTGEILQDKDGKLAAPNGQVAVSEPFKPGFDSTVYEDFKIFMPYSQLDVGTVPGTYKLRLQVQAYILTPYKLLASSEYVDFELTR